MVSMSQTIAALKDAGLRDTVKIMIGGAPVTADYAKQIGADGYAANAPEAVELAMKLAD
jgi:5-methyltetrahydrofolate--homocysteine methyltransferase